MDKIVKYIMTNEVDIAIRALQYSNYDQQVFNTFFTDMEVVQELVNATHDREFVKLVMSKFGDAITYPERFADIEILEHTGAWMNKKLKKKNLPLVARVVQTGYINSNVPEWRNHSIDVRIDYYSEKGENGKCKEGIELETGETFTNFDEFYYNDDGECCRICV